MSECTSFLSDDTEQIWARVCGEFVPPPEPPPVVVVPAVKPAVDRANIPPVTQGSIKDRLTIPANHPANHPTNQPAKREASKPGNPHPSQQAPSAPRTNFRVSIGTVQRHYCADTALYPDISQGKPADKSRV